MGAERQATWIAHVPVGYIVRYLESGGVPDDDWRSSVSGILPHFFREAGGTDVWVAWNKNEVAGLVDFLATWTVRDMGDGLTSGPHTRPHGIHIASGMPIRVRLVTLDEGRTEIRLITASLDWEMYDDLRTRLRRLVAHLVALWPHSALQLSPLFEEPSVSLPTIDRYADALESLLMPSLVECIGQGEGQHLEFKPVFMGDRTRTKNSQRFRSEVLQTIASYLNSEGGGTLLVGVEDDGAVCGIADDLSSVGDSQDRFQKALVDLISERMGADVANLIRIRFESLDGKTICVVDVEQASAPCYLREEDGRRHLFVRFANTTRRLDAAETAAYIQRNYR